MNEREAQRAESRWETVVEVLTEGGDICLFGRKTAQGWLFCREVVDQSGFLLDEPEIRHRSAVVDSLEKGLALLDRYPWYRMHVRKMHPDFAVEITAGIAARKKSPPSRVSADDAII